MEKRENTIALCVNWSMVWVQIGDWNENQIWLLKIRDIERPRKGLPGTRDRVPQTWDISYYTGWVATLISTCITLSVYSTSSSTTTRQQNASSNAGGSVIKYDRYIKYGRHIKCGCHKQCCVHKWRHSAAVRWRNRTKSWSSSAHHTIGQLSFFLVGRVRKCRQFSSCTFVLRLPVVIL